MSWQLLSGILGFLVVVGSAALVLMARRADVARETAERNVAALNGLVHTRDIQLADKTRDLEMLAAEHKQLIQVNVKEMLAAWERYMASSYFIENARLRRVNEELTARLGRHETV